MTPAEAVVLGWTLLTVIVLLLVWVTVRRASRQGLDGE